MPAMA